MELGHNDYSTFQGYVIQRKKDTKDWETNIGYIVTWDGVNVMPGAAWFKTLEEATQAIADACSE